MTDKTNRLTTGFGKTVDDDQNSVTAGPRGPVLMQDVHLLEKLGHFDRERIPSASCTPRALARTGTSR